tara:strand:- start:132 stop:320 length:189 start_codon:yes stop_codon:yes gene_type:complete
MILGQISTPKHKSDLVKRINQLKNVEFQLWEDVDNKQITNTINEIRRYVSNKETTIIVIKKR